MYSSIRKVFDLLEAMLKVAVISCMAAMVVTLILQVVLRYFFSSALAAGWEIARLSFVASLLLGIGLATRRGMHAQIEIFDVLLKNTFRRPILIVREILIIVLFVVVIDKSLLLYEIASDEMLTSFDISKNVFYGVQILASVMVCVFCFERILNAILGVDLANDTIAGEVGDELDEVAIKSGANKCKAEA